MSYTQLFGLAPYQQVLWRLWEGLVHKRPRLIKAEDHHPNRTLCMGSFWSVRARNFLQAKLMHRSSQNFASLPNGRPLFSVFFGQSSIPEWCVLSKPSVKINKAHAHTLPPVVRQGTHRRYDVPPNKTVDGKETTPFISCGTRADIGVGVQMVLHE